MQRFVYDRLPSRVVFGAGSLESLPAEVDRLGCKRALVFATSRAWTDDVVRRLGSRVAGIYDKAVMHVPLETARDARDQACRLAADISIAVGGGSTIGLAKAIALEPGLPILAIPTTFSGSEMTPIRGMTEGGGKRTGRDTTRGRDATNDKAVQDNGARDHRRHRASHCCDADEPADGSARCDDKSRLRIAEGCPAE